MLILFGVIYVISTIPQIKVAAGKVKTYKFSRTYELCLLQSIKSASISQCFRNLNIFRTAASPVVCVLLNIHRKLIATLVACESLGHLQSCLTLKPSAVPPLPIFQIFSNCSSIPGHFVRSLTSRFLKGSVDRLAYRLKQKGDWEFIDLPGQSQPRHVQKHTELETKTK